MRLVHKITLPSPKRFAYRTPLEVRQTSEDLHKNLRDAERSFRDLKTTLELRPVSHRLEHRIRGHVVVCWLALLLIRLAERKTGQS